MSPDSKSHPAAPIIFKPKGLVSPRRSEFGQGLRLQAARRKWYPTGQSADPPGCEPAASIDNGINMAGDVGQPPSKIADHDISRFREFDLLRRPCIKEMRSARLFSSDTGAHPNERVRLNRVDFLAPIRTASNDKIPAPAPMSRTTESGVITRLKSRH